MRAGFFGAWDPGYPRNRILRDGLALAGVDIVDVRVREWRAIFRYPALALAHGRAARLDACFVPAFRHKDVPLARLLARQKPVVFDPLVSRWDTLVEDWGLHARHSAQAGWNRRIDRWALTLPDAVLCDTWAHARLFEELGAPRAKLHRVAVGAEQLFFDLPEAPEEGTIELLYVGGFLPLHGVPALIEALALLEREMDSLPRYRVRLVGRGIEIDVARRRAAELRLERVAFEGPRPYAELARVMGTAHIVLGAFGPTAKAGRVVPHKVWQGLAAGRAVVTGDGAGVREWFEDGVHALLVPRGEAAVLATTLGALLRDAALRRRLGEAGRRRAAEVGTPAILGRELLGVFESLGVRA